MSKNSSEKSKYKEVSYFEMLVESVDYSCKCAEKVRELMDNYPSNAEELEKEISKIHDIEHAADIHFHKLYSRLIKEFLPPIDREDILELAQLIDDLTDLIEAVAQRLHMFNITTIRPDVHDFMDLVIKSCETLKEALKEFKNFKKSTTLGSKLRVVGDIEEEGDDYYAKAVRNLFVTSTDPIEIVKWREIYHVLEDCLDSASQIADTVEGVILKHS